MRRLYADSLSAGTTLVLAFFLALSFAQTKSFCKGISEGGHNQPFQSLVKEVQRLSKNGDYEAVNQMKLMHPELTKSAQALECFGFSDQDLRNMKYAMKEFQGAERLAPDDVHIQTSYVYGLYGLGAHREAQYRINRIVAEHPKDARCRAIQALILQQLGTEKEAAAALKEAEKLGMSLPVWEAKYDFAIAKLNQAQTIQVADACLKALPNDVQAMMFHGRAMRDEGKMSAAANDYRKVLKVNPNHMTALSLLAEVYQMEKKYGQAVECLERRLKLARHPHEMLLANRAIALNYEKANNLPAAAVARERAIADCVKRKQCRDQLEMKDILNCGRVLVTLKRWKDAEERLSLIIERYPQSVEALEKRAKCYVGLNRNADAIKDYDRLIEIQCDVASWYRQRASLLKRAGRVQEAEQDLRRAKQLQFN